MVERGRQSLTTLAGHGAGVPCAPQVPQVCWCDLGLGTAEGGQGAEGLSPLQGTHGGAVTTAGDSQKGLHPQEGTNRGAPSPARAQGTGETGGAGSGKAQGLVTPKEVWALEVALATLFCPCSAVLAQICCQHSTALCQAPHGCCRAAMGCLRSQGEGSKQQASWQLRFIEHGSPQRWGDQISAGNTQALKGGSWPRTLE